MNDALPLVFCGIWQAKHQYYVSGRRFEQEEEIARQIFRH
jgi:hypothetical protein